MVSAPLEDTPQALPVLSRERVYDGAIWDVVRETFSFNGTILSRDFVDHTGAAAVVALNERNEVMMIRQYRHAIRSLNWEIPAGLLDIAGEEPLECAKRELAEEADVIAERWSFLMALNTTPGGSNEFTHIFLAQGLRPADHAFLRQGEEAELETRFVPLPEVIEAILEGRIANQIAVTALLAAYVRLSR